MANELADKLYRLFCVDHTSIHPKVTLVKALHALVKLGFTGLTTPESEVLSVLHPRSSSANGIQMEVFIDPADRFRAEYAKGGEGSSPASDKGKAKGVAPTSGQDRVANAATQLAKYWLAPRNCIRTFVTDTRYAASEHLRVKWSSEIWPRYFATSCL